MRFLGLFRDHLAEAAAERATSETNAYKMAEDAFRGMNPEMRAQFMESRAKDLSALPPRRVHDVANYISQVADDMDRGTS